jgi:hypothetical protein
MIRGRHCALFALLLLLLGCSSYTSIDGAPAYHRSMTSDSRAYTQSIDADKATFVVLSGGDYAKDKHQVFYRGLKVAGADAASFVMLSDRYARDKAHIFSRGEIIPDLDIDTFELLPDGYIRDKNDVYSGKYPLQSCSPKTFRVWKDSWLGDGECLYVGLKKIRGVDFETFEVINRTFAKDSKHVYSSVGGVIPGADPATFRLTGFICQVCARDKDRCYSWKGVVSCDK